MITSQKTKEKALSYIADQYPLCLYLYLDLIKYDLESKTIDLYIQEGNGLIKAVLLQYYSCLHVYSKNNDFDVIELESFIKDKAPSIIYCTAETAERIFDSLSPKIKGTLSLGWVAQIREIDKTAKGLAQKAEKDDFAQIVRMIYEDEDIGRAYSLDVLARQLEERNKDGYARNLVIKENSIVVAHACTNAEINSIAVVAELLVRKDKRRLGYGSEIWRDICGQLLSEGKEVYSFYYSQQSRNLHQKIGFFEVSGWGKIVLETNK